MTKIEEIIDNNSSPVALYGLGTETQRFLADHGDGLSVAGLLDGFRTEGTMYGHDIIPLEKTIEKNVGLIIVVARPGSCKAITKRIGGFCESNGIALYDVRGRDLLAPAEVSYDLASVSGYTFADLKKKIDDADVVSFDLFDTLIARKVCQYTDVFELTDIRLKEKGINIPDLPYLLVMTEKELSQNGSPKLARIYEEVLKKAGIDSLSANELSDIEWDTDRAVMIPRKKVCDIFREAAGAGKTVVITSDCYYGEDKIVQLLEEFDLTGYSKLFVSSEYDTLKTQELFGELKRSFPNRRILHIGDDETADIKSAGRYGIDTFRLYSGIQLYDALGGLGMEEHIHNIADKVKAGLFLSDIFNDPFVFESDDKRISVDDASDIGYLFCAPMITDFTIWMQKRIREEGYGQILFGARDGYLMQKLYDLLDSPEHTYYFYTSRTAAIRAGMESHEDIGYVESMKYSGTPQKALHVRFGIESGNRPEADVKRLILERSKQQRDHYKKYISSLGMEDGKLAFFDLVAKGTTQMYVQKLFPQHMKGFYFLQLEPEFMAGRGLDIEPFYSDEEKDESAIFDNYYILETMLTAPHPQMTEMDENGRPLFAEETRSDKDIKVFDRAQRGMTRYFKDYIDILPESARTLNKKLDEAMLALINHIRILDEDFLALKVEDPFFGRMTDMTDVLG